MRRPIRLALEVLGAAASAGAIAWLLLQSRLFHRVKNFPDAVPGLEWKEIVAFVVPFVLLLWVFVLRRGATSSLVGIATVAALAAGHAYASLDWLVFVSRGLDLSRPGPAPAAVLVALALLFLLPLGYHVVRRRGELGAAYTRKGAEASDVAAARRASTLGGLAVLGDAVFAAAVVLGGVLVLQGRALAQPGDSTALALGIAAVAVAGAGLVAVPALAERWRARRS